MNILLLEIPSADHAYKGWLGGEAIRKIYDLFDFEHEYKLILSQKYLYMSILDISDFDIVHIECHSDEEGLCYNPTQRDSVSWENLLRRISKQNELKKKQLVISGCLAGNTDSQARCLAKYGKGFKRVFAFAEKIAYDKAIAVLSGFYYFISISKKWNVGEVRKAIQKIRKCFDVDLLYFYPSTKRKDGVNVFPKQ